MAEYAELTGEIDYSFLLLRPIEKIISQEIWGGGGGGVLLPLISAPLNPEKWWDHQTSDEPLSIMQHQ